MTTDYEFTRRLMGFGLSEKEAQTYLHLLKYGSKTLSPLAKSLHTYREDEYCTLVSLIEKGLHVHRSKHPHSGLRWTLTPLSKTRSRSGRAKSGRWRRGSKNCRNLQSNGSSSCLTR